MKKNLIIVTVVVLAIAAMGYIGLLKHGSDKYDFRFDKVSSGDLSVYVTATGTISAVISVDVGTQVSGIITKLYADFNSIVKEGQVIAQLDTTFLYQSLKDAEAGVYKAQAQLDDSKRNLAREKILLDKSLESQLNYDAALTTNESNEAALKSARATLDRAKIDLAYATIIAPINGVVVNRAVNVGQTVASSFSSPTLFTIANDLQRMQVQTTVDESDVGMVSIGQQGTFTVDAYPDETFNGTVSQIRLAPQSIQNVVNYIVVIDVNNDQLKLMPGMTANVKILVASAKNVMKVSNMALRFQPPAEIVDTTGAGPRNDALSGRSGGNVDTSRMGQNLPAAPGHAASGPGDRNQVGQNTGSGKFQALEGDVKRYQRIKDSIQAAHGGVLSQEELRAELRKRFASQTSSGYTSSVVKTPKPNTSGNAANFGIISTFPEYQKSAYVPSHQSGKGRVWILKSGGSLTQVFVRTGLNDGRYTEITSPKLKPGDQIVLGATPHNDSGSGAASNPLASQGQGRPMGGLR